MGLLVCASVYCLGVLFAVISAYVVVCCLCLFVVCLRFIVLLFDLQFVLCGCVRCLRFCDAAVLVWICGLFVIVFACVYGVCGFGLLVVL